MPSWRDSFRKTSAPEKIPAAEDFSLELAAGRIDRFLVEFTERDPETAESVKGDFGITAPLGPT